MAKNVVKLTHEDLHKDDNIDLLKQQVNFFRQESYYLLVHNNQIVDASERFIKTLGYEREKDLPMYFPELFPKHFPREFLAYHRLFLNHKYRKNYDLKLEGREGEIFTFRFAAQQLIYTKQDNISMLVGEDITYQSKKLDELSDNSSLFQFNPYSIAITDANGFITNINPKFEKKTQFKLGEIKGQPIFEIKQHKDFPHDQILKQVIEHKDFRSEFVSKRKDGSLFEEDLYVIPMYSYGELMSLLVIGEDITTRKQAIHSLQQKAYYDDLTGFYRKEVGSSLLYEICENEHGFGLFFVDYRDFKQINDAFGHQVGDEILREGSKRIRSNLRRNDVLIRWGGDEFVLVLPDVKTMSNMKDIAHKLVESFAYPVMIHDRMYKTQVDIGGCFCGDPDKHVIARNLILAADKNMYSAKKSDSLIVVTDYHEVDLDDQF